MVGFSTVPAAGDGTLTHALDVSLVSSQMETVSEMCPFKIGQTLTLTLAESPGEQQQQSKSKMINTRTTLLSTISSSKD